MKVSVVIPAYNDEPFLQKAVESVIHTNYPDLEIVIVEDGSSDNTLKVAQAIQVNDPDRIKLLRHKIGRNRGAGASRNLGMKHAAGEIVAFLDADDVYLPNRFDHCVQQIVDNGYDVVFEKSVVVHHGSAVSEELVDHDYKYLRRCAGGRIAVELLYDMPQTGAVTFRRSLLERTGEFNEKLSIGQDREFFMRLSVVGKVKNITNRAPVSQYVRHGANRWVPREHDTVYVAVIGSVLRWMERSRLRADLHTLYRRRLYSWTFERSDKCLAKGDVSTSRRYLLALGWHYPASVIARCYLANLFKLVRVWVGGART